MALAELVGRCESPDAYPPLIAPGERSVRDLETTMHVVSPSAEGVTGLQALPSFCPSAIAGVCG